MTNGRTENSFNSGSASIEELMSWSTPLVMSELELIQTQMTQKVMSVVCRASVTFDSENSGSCVILSRLRRLLHT